MRKVLIVAATILSSIGAANAVDDWGGIVKLQAAYDNSANPATPQFNATVDVVYDKAGRRSKAWGTMSYMLREGGVAGPAGQRIYAHAVCVGKFPSNRWTVAGKVAEALGSGASPAPEYLAFELDVTNKLIRAMILGTEALARASCATQTGLFPGVFNHGFVIAQ